jgi:hypothetical protein
MDTEKRASSMDKKRKCTGSVADGSFFGSKKARRGVRFAMLPVVIGLALPSDEYDRSSLTPITPMSRTEHIEIYCARVKARQTLNAVMHCDIRAAFPAWLDPVRSSAEWFTAR